MSEKHVRLVWDNSKAKGNARAVLCAIATDIGFNDEPSFTGVRTLASRVGVHYNTVSSCIKKLEESGELIVKRGEKGKGNRYSIPWQCDSVGESVTNGDEEVSQKASQLDSRSVTTVSQLIERVSQLEKIVSQLIDQSVTPITVTEERSKEEEKIEEESAPPPPIGTDMNGTLVPKSYGNHYQDFENSQIALSENGEAILTYITGSALGVSRSTMPKVRRIADTLDKAGYTHDDVYAHCFSRSGYWFTSDWRGKKGETIRYTQVEATCNDARKQANNQPQQSAGEAAWLQYLEPLLAIPSPQRSPHVRSLPVDVKRAMNKGGIGTQTLSDTWAKDKFISYYQPPQHAVAMAD